MSNKMFFRSFKYLIIRVSPGDSTLVGRVKVGARGQVVIPKGVRERLNIDHGVLLEFEETEGGILLRPYNPVERLRGLGEGLFGDPVRYQRKLREEWRQ